MTEARPTIRVRQLGSLSLSEDTKGPGQGERPAHTHATVGLYRGHDGSRRRVMVGRRKGQARQASTGARLRYLLEQAQQPTR